jgi:urease accessory protein
MLRARTTSRDKAPIPFDIIVLTHEERHLRRRVLTLQHGDDVLVDLPRATVLADGDRLELEDGRHVEVIAAEEDLMEVRPSPAITLAELAWHIGNRHVSAQIEDGRILLPRDHVVRDMLRGLGAWVRNVSEPFAPLRGAYLSHDHRQAQDGAP